MTIPDSPFEMAGRVVSNMTAAFDLLRYSSGLAGTTDTALRLLVPAPSDPALVVFDGLARIKAIESPRYFTPVADAFAHIAQQALQMDAQTAGKPAALVPDATGELPVNRRPRHILSVVMMGSAFAGYGEQTQPATRLSLMDSLERVYAQNHGYIRNAPPLADVQHVVAHQLNAPYSRHPSACPAMKGELAAFIAHGFKPLHEGAKKVAKGPFVY